MKQWIRWKGLLAFVAVTGLLAFFWLVLADDLVRRGIERTTAFLVGAEVNVDDANLTFSPLGFVVSRIQVTNPDNPGTNALEIRRMAFTLNTPQLFMRKTIIEDMIVEEVALGTPRERPGRVYRKTAEEVSPAPGERASWFEVPDISSENVRQALEEANLETVKSARALSEEIGNRNEFWDQRIEQLPDEDRLQEYQARIDALGQARKGDIGALLRKGTEVKDLYSDINADLNLLRDSYRRFSEDYKSVTAQVNRLSELPAQDARWIAQKYGPSPEGIGNISSMLFGEQAGVWVERSLRWHERISPMLDRRALAAEEQKELKPPRSEGIDMRFREYAPVPDFLVRKATVSVLTRGRTLTGTLANVTPDQDILGLPMTCLFSGENLEGMQGIRLDGTFNHVDPSNPRDMVRLGLDGYDLRPRDLGREILPVELQQGILDTGLTAVVSGGSVNADVAATVRSARFLVRQADEQAAGLSAAVEKVFSRLSGFSLNVGVSGETENYAVNVSSNLDDSFRGVIDTLAKDLTAQFQTQVRTALEQRVSGPINSVEQQAGSLERIDKELSKRMSFAESLLKSNVFSIR